MTQNAATPALSVVLPTGDGFSTIRQTVRALARQTIADKIELVIVAPTDHINIPADDVSAFAGTRVVNGGPVRTSNISRCAGIRAASAPVVVLAEDHSFPEPGWAEALWSSHGAGIAAVGPVLGNANPESMISWANLLLEYYPWLEGAEAGAVTRLPIRSHRTSKGRRLSLP